MPDAPDDLPLDGFCDPRFARVREAFRTNFTERGDVGAAVAICVGGRMVVDLWGGWADRDRQRPWRRDALVNVFSVSKGLATTLLLRMVGQGRLDLDARVAHCWPEFERDGKEQITLRHILSHRAGLPAIRETLPDVAMLDPATMARALERQSPWWPPGSAHGYHVNTFGHLVGEIVRRVAGTTLGSLLLREIAAPLEADIHIGLAASEHHRVAEFLWPEGTSMPSRPESSGPELMRWCAYANPPGGSGLGWVNTPAWRSAELPSTNGHATARGLARLYAALARFGELDGVRIVEAPVLREAVREHSRGLDLVLDRPSRFGVGFQLTQPERPLGPNPGSFGHFGTGGSLGFCDPDADLAFGYVMNDLGPRWQNPRNRALIDATYACL